MPAIRRSQEIEPEVALQLAWALVLRIYAGTDEVSFGCERPGRDDDALPGISNAIGSFSSVFPCKVDMEPTYSIKTCLKRIGLYSASVTGRKDLTVSALEHALGLKNKHLFNTCLSFQDSEQTGSLYSMLPRMRNPSLGKARLDVL